MKIGAQFYTLHDFCTTTERLAEKAAHTACGLHTPCAGPKGGEYSSRWQVNW